MQKITRKIVTMLFLSLLFIGLNVNVAPASPETILYIDPSYLAVQPCTEFTVNLNIKDVTDLNAWQVNITFNPSLMTCTGATEGPFLKQGGPTMFLGPIINNVNGWIMVGCALMLPTVGVDGSGTLAYITFHCKAPGRSSLQFVGPDTFLFDSNSFPISHKQIGGTVDQSTLYWKQSYPDYAPSGVPDFDQRQDSWGNKKTGAWKWTWCGPTAVANSLWWMDSRFEPGVTPPPTISDGFPLVQSYIDGLDDHDPGNVQPFITDLGWYMDTDGNRTGYPWNGTDVHQMEKGIAMYLRAQGLETEFVIKKMKKPDFLYVEVEIERCEDVILLLGIWQSYDGLTWWRVGGHYVTCAGVDSQNRLIAFSDPDADSAEAGGMGRVLPPAVPHPHPPRPIAPPQQDTLHNNASFVSHDVYSVNLASPSPGGTFAVEFYEPIIDPDFMQNIQGQNCPGEFKSQEGPWNPMAPFTAVEVEYSVIISPADWYFKPEQEDYAPSGVPDFDQKQWKTKLLNWTNPWQPIGTWSYCGPVAVTNSLWWLDSQFEPNPIPPPTINDGFPLVQSYSPGWDDHDPQNVPYVVEHLAWDMDTDGQRSGIPHCGTEVHDMEYGIDWYLQDKGLDWKFYEHTEKAPYFDWIEEEIKRCEDVILLLGFWQNLGTEIEPYWVRTGGHYVTCAGVDSTNTMLAISDPYIDNAEWGFPGRVIPPAPHPHTGPPETLHNNATYVSHDFYLVGGSPSLGGSFGLYQYPAEDIIDNFGSCQNTPEEFIKYDHEYVPGLPIYTEIEYAVVISCKGPVAAVGSEDGNVYVHDSLGNLLWYCWAEAPCVSVAFDNEANYLAAGWRISDFGWLAFFDVDAVTGGGYNAPLWYKDLAISESYHYPYVGDSSGHESMSVDVKYNFYNECDIVAAAHYYGLNLYDEWGNLIWQYFDEEGPETIVRISQDGNYIVCADGYYSGTLHYFSHLRDGVPGWGPGDGMPIWSFGGYQTENAVHWIAISGIGDYVAVSGWAMDYEGADVVLLLNRTGGIVWRHIGVGGLGSHLTRVDMPCHGRSVVAITEDLANWFGCDLYYFDDGGNGWDGGDGTPVWTYWPGSEVGGGHNSLHDFYTVSISGNGDVISAGGYDGVSNVYVLWKDGTLLNILSDGPTVQSVDLTFNGQYGILGSDSGGYGMFDKDLYYWLWVNYAFGPIRSVAISKIYPCMFPYPNHDVAVIDITTSKDGCLPMPTASRGFNVTVNVTVTNTGDFSETFTVTLYANSTLIESRNVVNLASQGQLILTFAWNTSGLAYGNYTLTAFASIVQDEINVYNNNYDTSGWILVTIPGDINGDFSCEGKDNAYVAKAYDTKPGDLKWNPNADINNDGKVEGKDNAIVAKYYDTHYP